MYIPKQAMNPLPTEMSEDETDNFLIRQKHWILQLINNEAYREAWFALQTVGDLWERLSYGYKYNELMERLEQGNHKRVDKNCCCHLLYPLELLC